MTTAYTFTPRHLCDECDGAGNYPVQRDDPDSLFAEVEAWRAAHWRCTPWGRISTALNLKMLWKWGPYSHWRETTSRCDGWHFIRCAKCSGTGLRRVS